MKVGVVGAGTMGTALARALLRAGHEVVVGSRRALSQENGLVFRTYAEAARFGNVVVLATIWDETPEAIVQSGSLRDRIVIDATNPEDGEGRSRVLADGASGGEHVARWAEGARVVKAFNHVYAPLLDTGPVFSCQKASVFYCGDDNEAKAQVRALIDELGFDPVDSGPLSSARSLEALAALIVELVRRQGHAPTNTALKLLRRAS
ncbi:MAG TPA: NADPH-dependent F420 reductase [Thermoanaerobaculia bacterium]